MPKKKRYEFNAETLSYEIHRVPFFQRFSWGFVLFLLSLVAFAGYYLLYTWYLGYDTPKSAELKRQSIELHSKLDLLNSKFERNNKILAELELRDNNIYRPVFGLEEITSDIRNAGFGGVDRYSHLDKFSNSEFIRNIEMSMDILYKKAFVQSKSYDDVAYYAKRSGDMALSVPAIPPVNLDNVRFASYFGFRSDPFTRAPRMHTGIDLSGSTGEAIYAAGNGRVITVGYNFFGYGNEVVVDHGFGYKTRYAHLHKVFVKEGDVITRGDQIATMGNSGRSKGPHLHYEVMYKDNRVNPLNYYSEQLRGQEYKAMTKPVKVASK